MTPKKVYKSQRILKKEQGIKTSDTKPKTNLMIAKAANPNTCNQDTSRGRIN